MLLFKHHIPYSQAIIKMKHLAAYLLLGLGGNTSPSASDVKVCDSVWGILKSLTRNQEVLESVGIEADDERLEKLISELEGKDINEVRMCATGLWSGGLTRYS